MSARIIIKFKHTFLEKPYFLTSSELMKIWIRREIFKFNIVNIFVYLCLTRYIQTSPR